ncbi:MAG TPA: 50S ribosomal protein L3 [bacterium]|nr:50S ribosomal protein L3 [bacterium]
MTVIIGRKVGMTQIFDDAGNSVPVTVIEAGPCVVVNVRTPARDGYAAVQVGFEALPERKVNRPQKGVFTKAKVTPRRVLREFRALPNTYQVGQEITVGEFAGGDLVEVVGVTKGHGFSGAMKRHNFGGQRDSHGVSLMHRAPGSIGSSDIARVWPGMRMPGRYGHERVTVRGLRIARVDAGRNLLMVQGAVPGPRGSVVLIQKAADKAKARAAAHTSVKR